MSGIKYFSLAGKPGAFDAQGTSEDARNRFLAIDGG